MTSYIAIDDISEVDAILSQNTFVILDFWAEWCPPCKAIESVFKELASKYSVPHEAVFAKVDVDKNHDIASRFKITAMPTFILIHKTEVLKTIQGANVSAVKAMATYTHQQILKEKREKGENVTIEEENEPLVDLDSIKDANAPLPLGEMARTLILVFIVMFGILYYLNKDNIA